MVKSSKGFEVGKTQLIRQGSERALPLFIRFLLFHFGRRIVEYAIILSGKLESLLNLNSVAELFSVLWIGIPITFLGYLIKGGWGASLALLAGIILFFSFKGMMPF